MNNEDSMESKLFSRNGKVIIGMIHLPALSSGIETILESALRDLKSLEKGGIHAIIVENYNDNPASIFLNEEDATCFKVVAKKVVDKASVPIGISALRNDWKSAFVIAKESGAEFIRLDALVDKVSMNGTVVNVNPKEVASYRRKIAAQDILLLADVQVKHAEMLEKKSIEKSTMQVIANGADAVIVTGPLTGIPPSIERIRKVKAAALKFPVIVGSGVNKTNAKDLLRYADGVIVGTSLKINNKVSSRKVRELVNVIRELQ